MFEGESQPDDCMAIDEITDNEYVIVTVRCAAEYAYDEKLKEMVNLLHKELEEYAEKI